jgi:murein hydrolase activator
MTRAVRALQVGLALAFWPAFAMAETPAPGASPSPDASQLRGVEDMLRAGQDQQKSIQSDIEAQRADSAKLSAALIDATAKVQEAERQQTNAAQRLSALDANAHALEASLAGRQDLVATILAGLQRMGRNPPPAILLKPGDVAEAIRAATALGGVLPELRAETEALANDLDKLGQLRVAIAQERDAAAAQATALGEDRKKLIDMIDKRQAALQAASGALAAGEARNSDLAKQAASLKDLLANAERQQREAALGQQAADDVAAKAAGLRGADPTRLRPAIAFADAKGDLPWPASGATLRAFGASDGYGGTERGLSISAKAGDIVAAPMDASVLFAGAYRTYGHVLILNAGDGYNMVLAGLGRLNVVAGQFVLAGEPVASVGEGATRSATAAAIGASEPILYIELRKDGIAVDPGPWFIKSEDEKARG